MEGQTHNLNQRGVDWSSGQVWNQAGLSGPNHDGTTYWLIRVIYFADFRVKIEMFPPRQIAVGPLLPTVGIVRRQNQKSKSKKKQILEWTKALLGTWSAAEMTSFFLRGYLM